MPIRRLARWRPHLARRAGLLACLVLAACASTPPFMPRVDDDAVARYRSAGYALAPVSSIQVRRVSGPLSEAPWAVTVARTEGTAVQPLVIYLPAMGDADDAPNRWTRLWAAAGYAVMTVQVLDGDANVWGTPEARSGDFATIARARFDEELMGDRIARLAALLGQIRTRSLRGEPGLERLDWNQLALAGSDLGGYTVQCIAGSTTEALAAVGWQLAPRAYIVISPYATRAARARPAPAHAPMLMISSLDDVDAYGVIGDPAVRRLAYDRLGEGERYYLELGTASHRWLSGHALTFSAADQPPKRAAMMPDEAAARRKPHLPGEEPDSMAPGDDEEMTPAKRAQLTASREELVKARSRVLTHAALSEVSVAGVSVAFLDDFVRGQGPAGAWLANSAGNWLQSGDRLKLR